MAQIQISKDPRNKIHKAMHTLICPEIYGMTQ